MSDTPEPDEPPSPLLAELTEQQQRLLELICRPLAVGAATDQQGWPVWDFVRRMFRVSYPGAEPFETLLSLPTIPTPGAAQATYGLWWRGTPQRSRAPLPDERIGPTIAGLFRWGQDSDQPGPANLLALVVRHAAEVESKLPTGEWCRAETSEFEVRDQLNERQVETMPVELVGQVLIHEHEPLAANSSQFNYAVTAGRGDFEPYAGVSNAGEFVVAVTQLYARAQADDLPKATLPLNATIDFLGYVLASDAQWSAAASGRLVDVPDLESVGLLTTSPATQAEFERRVSSLWNLISRFRVPKASDEDLAERNWQPATSGSVNHLEIWLRSRLGAEFDSACQSALRAIRDIGSVRQVGAHASHSTRTRALTAMARFGLPSIIADWPAAWQAVTSRTADAFDTIRVEVQTASPAGNA